MNNLLIIDDDQDVRSQMKWALSQDYQVLEADNRIEALELLRNHRPSVITLDLGLPPAPADVREGFAALEAMLRFDRFLKVVVITGQDERENALRAIELGAYDFFTKPIEIEALKTILKRAFYVRELERESRQLWREDREKAFEGMLGKSPSMQEVFSTIRKVAASEVPVLISGESGTGKELAARAIHRLSRRNKGAFVAINCGAIPDNLLESELFGHEKGAFTGAHMQRPGQIEAAEDGTLFLDEIGELPLALQVKILRFLQTGRIQRVGGRKELDINARIMAATNIDLEKALAEQTFREDLYYRLAVVVISMPPLRERDEDRLLMAQAFLERYAAESSKKIAGFASDALEAVECYGWPGNVRELENRIRRGTIMAEGRKITLQDLGLDPSYSHYQGLGLREARASLEKSLIERALARSQGNVARAAEELGVSRPTLYDLMGKLGINR